MHSSQHSHFSRPLVSVSELDAELQRGIAVVELTEFLESLTTEVNPASLFLGAFVGFSFSDFCEMPDQSFLTSPRIQPIM